SCRAGASTRATGAGQGRAAGLQGAAGQAAGDPRGHVEAGLGGGAPPAPPPRGAGAPPRRQGGGAPRGPGGGAPRRGGGGRDGRRGGEAGGAGPQRRGVGRLTAGAPYRGGKWASGSAIIKKRAVGRTRDPAGPQVDRRRLGRSVPRRRRDSPTEQTMSELTSTAPPVLLVNII